MVKFLNTYHYPDPQRYIFDVAVQFIHSDQQLEKSYHIESEESILGAYFDNSTDAMNKASLKLIKAIINDLDPWLMSVIVD